MDSMSISLPGPLKAFIDGQVTEGRYSSASEYVRELIRADEKRGARDKLETLLLEGFASPETSWTPESAAELRASVHAGR